MIMLWCSSGSIIESRVVFCLLCMLFVEVNMYVGLFVNVFVSYCGVVLFRKYLSGVVMLLKCVGELSVRFMYFFRLCIFM